MRHNSGVAVSVSDEGEEAQPSLNQPIREGEGQAAGDEGLRGTRGPQPWGRLHHCRGRGTLRGTRPESPKKTKSGEPERDDWNRSESPRGTKLESRALERERA